MAFLSYRQFCPQTAAPSTSPGWCLFQGHTLVSHHPCHCPLQVSNVFSCEAIQNRLYKPQIPLVKCLEHSGIKTKCCWTFPIWRHRRICIWILWFEELMLFTSERIGPSLQGSYSHTTLPWDVWHGPRIFRMKRHLLVGWQRFKRSFCTRSARHPPCRNYHQLMHGMCSTISNEGINYWHLLSREFAIQYVSMSNHIHHNFCY
jgi:hypothetical protein